MKTLVMDASTVIDTLQNPPLAQHLVAHHDLCAPALVRWEVGNVVHVKAPDAFGPSEQRKRIVALLLSPIRVVDQAARLDAIADLAESHGLTFYDAAYLQLAIDEGADLLSQDKALLKAASKELGAERARDLARAEAAWKKGGP